MFHGNTNAKVLFISDFLRNKELVAQEVLTGERKDILVNALSSAGVLASEYAITVIHPTGARANKPENISIEERAGHYAAIKELINSGNFNVLVPMGEYALNFITGLSGIYKHHLSLYKAKAEFGGRKTVPILHTETIQKNYGDVAYIRFGAMRIREEMSHALLTIPERRILTSLDLSFDEQVDRLESIIKNATEVSTDVETGNRQVNTVGLATSSSEALVIEALPSGKTPAQFYKLWDLFRKIWQSEHIGKIAQNALFEMEWASIYGIRFKNISFDTMLAMRYLHPTLDRGLDNVGRIYTRFNYWKDDHSDWNDIRNWRNHLTYCGQDSIGQFAAKENMTRDLRARGMIDHFHGHIMPQVELAFEMMSRGMRLDEGMLDVLRQNALNDIKATQESFDTQCLERIGKKISLSSHAQVKMGLKEIGLKLPTTKGKETTSKTALMKLKNKYPKETLVRDIIKLNELKRKTEEYLNFEYENNGRVRFSMDPSKEETGIWSGGKTIFDKGFDPTTAPRIVKSCIVADTGKSFIEIKLIEPELYYISQTAPDYKMADMLSKSIDIAKYIASKLFNKDIAMVNITNQKVAAQVIKSANEMHSEKQFVEKCFSRSGVIYTNAEAKRFMQIYFEEFPGCRARIDKIKKEMYSKRMLENKLRKITYYDRVNDSLVRRALAWGPESFSQDEILNLANKIKHSFPEIEFVSLSKNSLLMQGNIESLYKIVEQFHNEKLRISVGDRWGNLENI